MMIITELYRVCHSQPSGNTLQKLLLSEKGLIQLTVTLAVHLADISYEVTIMWSEDASARHHMIRNGWLRQTNIGETKTNKSNQGKAHEENRK